MTFDKLLDKNIDSAYLVGVNGIYVDHWIV